MALLAAGSGVVSVRPSAADATFSSAQTPRLKASFDISKYSPANQVILRALKKYGMFVADNGPGWFLSGAPNPRWSKDDLGMLKTIKGSNFEVVRMGTIVDR